MLRPTLVLALAFLASFPLAAQINVGGVPYSQRYAMGHGAVPSVRAATFDRAGADAEDHQRAVEGAYPADARLLPLDADIDNNGAWTELANGDGVWRLRVVSNGALATELYFRDFDLPAGAVMHIYDDRGEQLLGGFTKFNCKPHGQFATAIIEGEASIVEYYEPASVRGQGYFRIAKVGHTYRRLVGGERADFCEVDVNCDEGLGWQGQRDGVVRVRMVENGNISGFCSGGLMNNVTLDCKPYILTANHCGPSVSATDMLDWKFYFKYQRTGCGTGIAVQSKVLTGAVERGESNDNGGATGSDFLLVEAEDPPPADYTPFWLGWDATASPHVGGKGIHHPAGSEKKISTFTVTASNSFGWNGLNTHCIVSWAQTANGWGITEPGSSGSPLFESGGKVIGTLSGGTSCCVANGCDINGSGPEEPDWYGRMNYHWSSNGGPASDDLKNWLDPNNTGTLTLAGSYGPCGSLGLQEKEAIATLAVYPNPATSSLRIEHPAGAERIEVIDLTGRTVLQAIASTASVSDIDVNALASGSYVVRAFDRTALIATAKIEIAAR